MKRLVLAAVLGAVLAMGLYSVSADGGDTIGTTLGDESNTLVALHGPLSNPVNHPCPNNSTITTGSLSKDDPILNLCWFWEGPVHLPKLPPMLDFSGGPLFGVAPMQTVDLED